MKTILYIEDDGPSRKLMERLFERFDEWELLTSSTGKDGFSIAKERHPQLVLLDLHLPDCHGSDVIAWMQDDEVTRDMDIVILSADAQLATIEKLKALGVKDFLTKPLTLSTVVQKIQGLLQD